MTIAQADELGTSSRPGQRVVVYVSEIGDVYSLARRLRPADLSEVLAMGCEPVKELRANYRGAFLRRTVYVDGQIAAMWGCYGSAVSDIGYPYLLTSRAAEQVPRAFVRVGRDAVAEMLMLRSRLEGRVAASYRGACRLLEVLGATLGPPVPFGPHGVLFRPYVFEREA